MFMFYLQAKPSSFTVEPPPGFLSKSTWPAKQVLTNLKLNYLLVRIDFTFTIQLLAKVPSRGSRMVKLAKLGLIVTLSLILKVLNIIDLGQIKVMITVANNEYWFLWFLSS